MNTRLTTSSQRRTQSPSARTASRCSKSSSLWRFWLVLAALGEVMRMAGQAARLTEDETQQDCSLFSVMDELACGRLFRPSINRRSIHRPIRRGVFDLDR